MTPDRQIPPGALTPRAQPESFRARSLSVSLTVDDIHESLAWYRDVIRFTVDRKHEQDGELRAVALIAGDARILLSQDDGARGWDRRKGEGLSLYLTTAEDVDEVARQVKERGGELESEPTDMPWGSRVFRLLDPDGFRLAIGSEPTE